MAAVVLCTAQGKDAHFSNSESGKYYFWGGEFWPLLFVLSNFHSSFSWKSGSGSFCVSVFSVQYLGTVFLAELEASSLNQNKAPLSPI